MGIVELLLIALFAVLVFGAPALTFWIGYTMGSKRTSAETPRSEAPSDTPSTDPGDPEGEA